ncbi:MAG TPA: hypothetical protein VF068_06380 [Rubrobacter sp.]
MLEGAVFFVLFSRRPERTVLSATIVFVAAGFGPAMLGLVKFERDDRTVLFTDDARTNLLNLRHNEGLSQKACEAPLLARLNLEVG